MIRSQLTEKYLREVERLGIDAGWLSTAAQRTFDLTVASYEGRCLSRPVFLEHTEKSQLATDLDRLLAALAALPEQLFGGDIGTFAEAAGLLEPQVAAVRQAGLSAPPPQLGRADMYHDGSGFRLMEMNLGSNTGGLDTALLNKAFLSHPGLAAFVEEAKLAFVDTLAEVVDTLRAECHLPSDRVPVVAAVDWPASFATLEPQLRHSAAALRPLGIEAVPCHLGHLEVARGRVWLDGRAVDAVYRIFSLEDLSNPAAAPLTKPLLDAVAHGEVPMFTPIHSELYGSKAALAMLSDEANRHRHDPETLASLDRILPWTRMVREGTVTVDGAQVELLEYAFDQRPELVLKPTSQHGGTGVVLGWQVNDSQWHRAVRAAVDKGYVLQRRLRAVPESFPAESGELESWLLRWGVFTVNRGYGGATVVGTTRADGAVVNMATGGTAGCCFHETAP